MNRSLLKYDILMLLMIFISNVPTIFANDDKPVHPKNLQVYSWGVGGFAKIKWQVVASGTEINGFKIYFAPGKTDNLSNFDLLDSISSEDTMLHNENENYHWIFEHVGFGDFSFYITAFNEHGESEPSDTVTQTIGESAIKIEFHTKPDTDAIVGENYYYKAVAKASNLGLIKYDLVKAPDGMELNETTGEISWTPLEKGKYAVNIKAYLIDNKDICQYQPFTVNVKSCNKRSTISGTVSYTEGGLVESGFAKLYKKVDQTPNDPILINTLTISNGYFTVNVDEGNYFIKIEGDKFVTEWYENAGNLNEAKIIHIKCGDSFNVVADVNKAVTVIKYMVTGRVTRESDGEPVANAAIRFEGKNQQSGEIRIFPAVTGSNGYFEIKLENNFNYISYITGFQNYLTQYYNKVDNPTEATQIILQGNRDNIDFVLKEKPAFSNRVVGTVTTDDGNGIAYVKVIAFLVDPAPDKYREYIGKPATTDESGIFKFENLNPGRYIFMFFSSETRNIPGYYKSNTNTLVKFWRDATKVEIGTDTEKSGIILKAQRLPVLESARGKIRGSAKESGNNNTIPYAVVFALDMNSNTKYFTISDDLGNYEIRGMKAGKYHIFSDKIGYYQYKIDIELQDDNSIIDNQITLIPYPTSVSDDNDYKNIMLYPNPADNEINLSVTGLNSELHLKVYNSLGIKLIDDSTLNLDNQTNIKLNLSNLSNGLYYLEVVNGLKSQIYPFVISR